MKTAFKNDTLRGGFLPSMICRYSANSMYTESWSNFFLILHWGYSVLGAVIHLAVKESLSAMHTGVVHGVGAQSHNVRECPSIWLKHFCLSSINSSKHQWRKPVQQSRALPCEVLGLTGDSVTMALALWLEGWKVLFCNISAIYWKVVELTSVNSPKGRKNCTKELGNL